MREKADRLMKKYRSPILYVVFGVMTFIISVSSYAFFIRVMGLNELIANALSWIFAVLFAFFTNRKWVFDGQTNGKKDLLRQMVSFFGGRGFTLLIEEAILFVFVTQMELDGVIVKVFAQVVVIVSNYFISKFVVFRKRP